MHALLAVARRPSTSAHLQPCWEAVRRNTGDKEVEHSGQNDEADGGLKIPSGPTGLLPLASQPIQGGNVEPHVQEVEMSECGRDDSVQLSLSYCGVVRHSEVVKLDTIVPRHRVDCKVDEADGSICRGSEKGGPKSRRHLETTRTAWTIRG